MFHTYVIARSGSAVDIDRASFLMDQDLFQEALDAMRHERDTGAQQPASWAQWVWDYYCARHREIHCDEFIPDVNPEWDR